MERYEHDIREFGETGYKYTSCMRPVANGEWVEYAAAQARIEKLERIIVWMADGQDMVVLDDGIFIGSEWHPIAKVTPASILAAVEKAMGE